MLNFLSYLLIALAAILNALMDIVENENFVVSKLKDKNQKFWYKRESWKYAKKIFGWKLDSWHISKTLCGLILFIDFYFIYKPYIPILDFSIGLTVWILTFNLFYNRIFK